MSITRWSPKKQLKTGERERLKNFGRGIAKPVVGLLRGAKLGSVKASRIFLEKDKDTGKRKWSPIVTGVGLLTGVPAAAIGVGAAGVLQGTLEMPWSTAKGAYNILTKDLPKVFDKIEKMVDRMDKN